MNKQTSEQAEITRLRNEPEALLAVANLVLNETGMEGRALKRARAALEQNKPKVSAKFSASGLPCFH